MKDDISSIPLLIPDMPSTAQLLPWLEKIEQNHWYSNFGPLNIELEKRLSRFYPACHIATTSNATTALELSLAYYQLPPGAKVLVPAYTFLATAMVIARLGLQPVFCDVAQQSWQLTPALAEQALSEHTIAAIMPVASLGLAVDIKAWDDFSRQHKIPVIIDAAGAFGQQVSGEYCPLVFSLHATKALAAAEGGFVVCPQPAMAKYIHDMSNFGMDTERVAQAIGMNAKLSEYHAACALASLANWTDVLAKRHQVFNDYQQRLQHHAGISFAPTVDNAVPSLLTVYLAGHDVAQVSDYLTRQNIGNRRWYYPLLPEHPAFASDVISGQLRVSQQLARHSLGLPFYASLTVSEIDFITEQLVASLCDA